MMYVDWTRGVAALAYQQCAHCGRKWAFARAFCPYCGAAGPESRIACGAGVVYSVTRVDRAPTAEMKALAPYTIVLVDLAEDVRVMAHGDAGLAIGAKVRAAFRDFGGRVVPHFEAGG